MRALYFSIILSVIMYLSSACSLDESNGADLCHDRADAVTKIIDDGGIFAFSVGAYNSLAFDNNNIPHIAYYDLSNGDLKYASLDMTREQLPWQLEVADNGVLGEFEFDVGSQTSIAVDPFGQPHICYQDVSHGALKYAAKINGEWQVYFVDDRDLGEQTSCSLALDTNAVAHISYHNSIANSINQAIVNLNEEELSIFISVVDSGEFGPYTSIAMRDNRPVIAYHDAGLGQPKIAIYNDIEKQWEIKTISDNIVGDYPPAGLTGRWISMAVDELNDIHLAYQDETTEDLWYAKYDGETWRLESVATEGRVGSYASIAIADPSGAGQPVISYYDATYADLMIAMRRETGQWDTYSVYTPFLGGTWSSLKTSIDGKHLAISFFDPYNNWLLYSRLDY